jgi:hypothetical protein
MSVDPAYQGRLTLHYLDENRDRLTFREGNHRVFRSPHKPYSAVAAGQPARYHQPKPSAAAAAPAASAAAPAKPAPTASSASSSASASASASAADVKYEKSSEPGAASDPLCVLCESKPKDTALQPCGHVLVCDTCARMVQHCFECNLPVSGFEKVES